MLALHQLLRALASSAQLTGLNLAVSHSTRWVNNCALECQARYEI